MKHILNNVRIAVIVWLISISVFCLLFGKPAYAEKTTQYAPNVKIILLDTITLDCNYIEANGSAYALNTDTQDKAIGCWKDYGEIYEIQLKADENKYFHYYLNAGRFEVK